MTQTESRMTNVRSLWLGRLLAIADGVLFGWFLFLSHAFIMRLQQAAEFVSHELRAPRLTHFACAVIPDEAWSLVTGLVCLSMGFGLISLHSMETTASRLFRWTFIAVLTLAVGMSLPIFDRYKDLSGGPDDQWWDEVLFVVFSAAILVFGIVKTLRRLSNRS